MTTLHCFPVAFSVNDLILAAVAQTKRTCQQFAKNGVPEWSVYLDLSGFMMFSLFKAVDVFNFLTPWIYIAFVLILAGGFNTKSRGNSILNTYKKQHTFIGIKLFSLGQLYKINKLLGCSKEFLFSQTYNHGTSKQLGEDELVKIYIDSTKLQRYNDKPNGYSQIGYRKNNTVGMCVGLNAANLSNGLPILSDLFNGNDSDQMLLETAVYKLNNLIVKPADHVKNLLVSIDKGYGCKRNLLYIVAVGADYLVALKFKNSKDDNLNKPLGHFLSNYVDDSCNSFNHEKLAEDLQQLPYKVEISSDKRIANVYVRRKLEDFAKVIFTEDAPEQAVQYLKNNGYEEDVEIVVDLNKRKKEFDKHQEFMDTFSNLSEIQQVSELIDTSVLKVLDVELREDQDSATASEDKSSKRISPKQAINQVIRLTESKKKLDKLHLYAGVRMFATSNLELVNQGVILSKEYSKLQHKTENGHKLAKSLGVAPLHFHTNEGLEGKNVCSFIHRYITTLIEIKFGVTSQELDDFLNMAKATVLKNDELFILFDQTVAETACKLKLAKFQKYFSLEQNEFLLEDFFTSMLESN